MGKTNYNAIKNNPRKLEPLAHHFEYLTNLGEVRARLEMRLLMGLMGQLTTM